MRYIIIDRDTGEVVGNLAGYTTLRAAREGRLSYPQAKKAFDFVRNVLKCPPGDIFRNNLYQYAEDHFEIVEINKIFLQSSDGRIYTKKV